tara:strand:+ start:110 stop:868 length:759 start_codon:yes stop_codon:yes gene_type:complete
VNENEEIEEKKEATVIPVEPEVSSFKLIFSLGLAGLISGIIIVGSYLYTLPIIEKNKAEAQRTAIFKVLEGCTSFVTLHLIDGKLVEDDNFPKVKKEAITKEEHEVFAGFDADGKLIGFAIPAAEPGFQDIIGTIFGYDVVNQTIIGFEVLESKETPGLGDKIFKDADFALNFKSLATIPEILPVKKGAKKSPNQIETITGATISSKAVIRILNNAIKLWQEPINKFDKSLLKPPTTKGNTENSADKISENE